MTEPTPEEKQKAIKKYQEAKLANYTMPFVVEPPQQKTQQPELSEEDQNALDALADGNP